MHLALERDFCGLRPKNKEHDPRNTVTNTQTNVKVKGINGVSAHTHCLSIFYALCRTALSSLPSLLLYVTSRHVVSISVWEDEEYCIRSACSQFWLCDCMKADVTADGELSGGIVCTGEKTRETFIMDFYTQITECSELLFYSMWESVI